jgi:NhaA family Na+:H+ antiporter
LLLWINDGLMAIFFLVVGLEIKREVLVGELSSLRAAALPIAAAIGGMAVPALFYVLINAGKPTADGWGIPMATDIAFALGVLALLGTRAPLSLKIFLTAVAIVDDLGAILVIAIFFSENIGLAALATGAGFIALLVIANRLGIRDPLVYFLLGIGLWVAFLKSGIHPTLAGVIAAMTIPATTLIDEKLFLDKARSYTERFAAMTGRRSSEARQEQQHALFGLEKACNEVEPPMTRLEHALHPWVAFVIMPLFALANAGILIGEDFLSSLGESVSIGVIVGLAVGKPVGIVLAAWIAVRSGIASMPQGLNWTVLLGGGMLAGIGFTMSLFISGLAFDAVELVEQAKAGILVASLLAGIAGYLLIFRVVGARREQVEEEARESSAEA